MTAAQPHSQPERDVPHWPHHQKRKSERVMAGLMEITRVGMLVTDPKLSVNSPVPLLRASRRRLTMRAMTRPPESERTRVRRFCAARSGARLLETSSNPSPKARGCWSPACCGNAQGKPPTVTSATPTKSMPPRPAPHSRGSR